MTSDALRRGDLVEVRGPAEILATLDESGCLDGFPFMPEMVAYCGRRFLVDRRADKICDTTKSTGSRKLPNTVLLADLRCDGSKHAGCQADCRLFWKEAWLRKVAGQAAAPAPPEAQDIAALMERTTSYVKHHVTVGQKQEERWRCQLTQLFEATEQLSVWDPRVYLEQYTNGNVTLGHCLRVTARAVVEEPLRTLGMTPEVYMRGTATAPVTETLNLQPGEWVQIRSKEEILATLMPNGSNRGMWFDREMAAFCGGTYRVKRRITRFIDDIRTNGCLVDLKTDAVMLEGVVCSGELSTRRWFCPRQATPYWRECWLRRTEAPAAGT